MTWEPRNKCDFEGDLEDPQQPENFHQQTSTGKRELLKILFDAYGVAGIRWIFPMEDEIPLLGFWSSDSD